MGAFMCGHKEIPSKTGDKYPKKRGRNTHRIAKLLVNAFLIISGTRVIDSNSLSKLEVSMLDRCERCDTRAPDQLNGKNERS